MATQGCPCGYRGDSAESCRCSPPAIARYRARLSGPLWDRLDLRIEVARQEATELLPTRTDVDGRRQADLMLRDGVTEPKERASLAPGTPNGALSQATLCRQVAVARTIQLHRAGCLNARLPVQRLTAVCPLDGPARSLLERGQKALALSGRGLHRVLRVARTIADLAGEAGIGEGAMAEALQLRRPLNG